MIAWGFSLDALLGKSKFVYRYNFGTVVGFQLPYRGRIATIVKTLSGTWNALIRKTGFPTTIKTFRLKRDAEDWARRIEDEMVLGLFVQRAPAERLTFEKAM